MFRVYYYGLRKWDNYLLDIDQDIQDAGENTQQLARESKDIHHTVRGGFEDIRSGIEGLQYGIEDLRAEFQWGFSLLADRLDTQISIMTGIAKKLDAINAALDAPLDKQARELFRIGLVRLRDGLDDKALESFLQSEKKNDVDFVLQLYIGKLYLYGKGVRNLRKATDHLLLAARYAEAKRGRIDDWNRYAAEAYFHAAIAAYIDGEKALGEGKQHDLVPILETALGFLSKAGPLWPEFLEIAYTRAKCCALLGKGEEVRQCFAFLSDKDRRYFLKAAEDKDFDSCRNILKGIAEYALSNPGTLAQQIIKRLGIASNTKADFATLDFDLIKRDLLLDGQINSLINMTDVSLTSQLKIAQSAAAKNDETQRNLQVQVCSQTKEMNSRTGVATGCGMAALTYFVIGPILLFIFGTIYSNPINSQSINQVITGSFVLAVIVWFITTQIFKGREQAPFRSAIVNLHAGIAKCDLDEPAFARETERSYNKLHDFQAWRDSIEHIENAASNLQLQIVPGDCSVTLTGAGPNRIDTVKTIREVTGLDLREALNLADRLPSVILTEVTITKAKEAISKFKAIGAIAEIEQARPW
jgi:ribosomal protein L7/L12